MFRSSKSGGTVSPAGSAHPGGRRNLCEDQRQWTYFTVLSTSKERRGFLLRAKRTSSRQSVFPAGVQEPGRLHKRSRSTLSASHRAARKSLANQRGKRTKIRSSKYLNNLIEQDHDRQISFGPMLGMNGFGALDYIPVSNSCID